MEQSSIPQILSFSIFKFLSFCIVLATAACGDRVTAPVEVPATGPITIAVAGDTVLTRPVESRDAAFTAVRDIVSTATLAFANLDMNVLEQAPPADDAAVWPFARPRDVTALRALGIDVVSLANDHATDYGVEGLMATRRVLDATGLLHVGTGPDLAAARAPLHVGGRISIIAVATSSSPGSRASASRGDIQGRPGLNPLRYAADVTVDAKTFDTLRDAASVLNPVAGPVTRDGAAGTELSLFGTTIKKGDRTVVDFLVDERDEREILDQVKAARAEAEVVIVSVHSHEPTNASPEPAEFLRRFARRAIDAGAHAIVGHGPHRLRGIEVYNGGVIFYSVGNFIYQTSSGVRAGFDAGTDLYTLALGATSSRDAPGPPAASDSGAARGSVLAVLTFEPDGLRTVRLHPVVLDENGLPRRPDQPAAAEIQRVLESLSRQFGTMLRQDGESLLVELTKALSSFFRPSGSGAVATM